jgi:hypothetical protein
MPMAAYMVNNNNNTIYITVGGTDYTVQVPAGDYTPQTFADAVETALALNVAGTQFEVTYNTVRDNFSLWANNPFTIDFKGIPIKYPGERVNIGAMVTPYKSASAARLLGFANQVYNSGTSITGSPTHGYTNLLNSAFRRNFNENKYVVLHVSQMTVNKSINNTISKSLTLIQPSYATLNVYKDEPIRKTFNPPIARVAKLYIALRDYWGNLYDFQNQDHRLEIIFMSHKHLSRYR